MEGIKVFKSDIRAYQKNKTYIEEYLENGQLEDLGEQLFIPNKTLMFFSSKDRQMFQLPNLYHGIIHIEGKGILGKPDFRYHLKYYNFFNGTEKFLERKGFFLFENGKIRYILSEHFYQLHETVDKLNQDIIDGENSLITLCHLKNNFANQKNISLDQYLQNENVNVPDALNLEINSSEEGAITLQPQLKGDFVGIEELNEGFQQSFAKSRRVKNTYSMRDENGHRERIYIKDKVKEGLSQILPYARGEKTEEEIQKVFKHPQIYFDPNIIDLDRFSARVLELGYYQPEYQGIVIKKGNDWVPGLIIEEMDGERNQILITTLDALEHFEGEIQEAEINHKDHIEAQAKKIPLSEAKKAAEIAREVLTFEPKEGDNELPQSLKDKGVILIIKEEFEVQETKSLKDFEYHAPPNLRSHIQLYNYQKEGIAWMQALSNSSSNIGGLLGDDMGLGKTLQVLSYIDWHQQLQVNQSTNLPYLIVAPVTLLENWQNEFYKFFDSDIHFIPFYGSDAKSINLEKLTNKHVLLTTYETLRSKHIILKDDGEPDYTQSLSSVKWAGCFLDEAQRIKTPGTLITNAAKSLNAQLRIAMTGTPVENSLVDLWCIMDFLMPGLLGSKNEFKKTFNKNTDDESEFAKLGEALRQKIDFYLIRRLKLGNLEGLPKKNLYPLMYLNDGVVNVENDELSMMQQMPELQKKKYLGYIKAVLTDKENKQNKGLKMIWGIKQISDHPYILDQNIQSILSKSSTDLIESSAKLTSTIKILDKIQLNDEKVIVFTESGKMQRLLKKVLEEKYQLPHISIINGQTSTRGEESRQKTVDKFQCIDGFNIIIMSPIAAGYGLNVTGANHVIHYTRHWNPAKEAQATDRVYRIGQKKEVHIYYPMSTLTNTESFDLKLAKLLGFKMMLSDSSMFPSTKLDIKEEQLISEDISIEEGELEKVRITSKDLGEKDDVNKKNIIALILQKQFNLSHLKVKKRMGKVQIYGTNMDGLNLGFALLGDEFNAVNNPESLKELLLQQENQKEQILDKVVLVSTTLTIDDDISAPDIKYVDLENFLMKNEIYDEDTYVLI
ncbi:DEAD/DEAH box helicase [Flammeovirga sp. EKP202]|uniref:DEAD/DEAH box helicase n=1 Tax=Flammeovirga sp. EKP202 TaxID=2770592 RepID=UPI00166004D5|nr:DEAD/DEAH box helicase [Flammeovirga sp. EKP202]MBD0404011.1 DEAD/DEAH box helicase [Flammeovirga sp. EKP202]